MSGSRLTNRPTHAAHDRVECLTQRHGAASGTRPRRVTKRVAEDIGFEPLRAVNPTRFPTLGSTVPGCPQTFAERETDVAEPPWTGPNQDN